MGDIAPLDYINNHKTVKPVLTATSEQRPPDNNGHLSTTANLSPAKSNSIAILI
jgi:hypothetical protein